MFGKNQYYWMEDTKRISTHQKGKLLEDVNSFIKTDYFKDCLREENENSIKNFRDN